MCSFWSDFLFISLHFPCSERHLIEFCLNFNWKWQDIFSEMCSFWSDFLFISFHFLDRVVQLVWGGPEQNLVDFCLNFNWKCKKIGLGLRKKRMDVAEFQIVRAPFHFLEYPCILWFPLFRTQADWFLFELQLKMEGTWSKAKKRWGSPHSKSFE